MRCANFGHTWAHENYSHTSSTQVTAPGLSTNMVGSISDAVDFRFGWDSTEYLRTAHHLYTI